MPWVFLLVSLMAITTQQYDRLTASSQAAIAWAYGRHVVAGNLMLRHDEESPLRSTLFISLGEGEWDAPETIWLNGAALDPADYHFHPGIDGQAGTGGVTGDQKIDLWFPAGLEQLTFSRTAYIVVRVTDPAVAPERDFDVRGIYRTRKVGIYDGAGTQTSFVWSANPVWQALDLLLLDQPPARINFASFVAEAAYAAELITIDSIEYPRFVSHLAFTSQTNVGAALETVLATCRGYLIDDGGKIAIRLDKARAAAHTLRMSNIFDKSFRAFTRKTRRVPNKLLLDFRDIENDHEFISFTDVERKWHQDLVGRVQEQRLDLGNTYQQQARRIGHYYLQRSVDDQQMCSLRAFADAGHLQPGDRVDVDHMDAPWAGLKAFEVIEATEEPDDTRELVLQEYDVNAFTDAGDPQQLIEGGVILGPVTNPDVAPGDVTSLVLDSIEQDPEDPMLARMRFTYVAPDPLNDLDGVEVQREAPEAAEGDPVGYASGKVYPEGWHKWTANPGEIILRVPYPARDERWYIYAVARNPTVLALWKHRSDGAPTPFVQVDVPSNPGGGGTVAPNVTSVVANPSYLTLNRARTGTKRFQVAVSWTLPTGHADYARLRSVIVAIADDATGLDVFRSGLIAVNHDNDTPTSHTTAFAAQPDTTKNYKARVYALNEFGQVSAAPGESSTFEVGPVPEAPSIEEPITVDVGYDIQGEGPVFRFEMTWTLPTGHADYEDGYEGVEIQARPSGSAGAWSGLAVEDDPVAARNTGWFPRPAETSDWDIRFVPYNPKKSRNLAEAYTYANVTVLGADAAANVTSFSAVRKTRFNELGGREFGFLGAWTNPAAGGNFDGVIVTAQASGEDEFVIAVVAKTVNVFDSPYWPEPEGSITYTIRAYALNKHGKRSGSPPSQNIVIAPNTIGDLRLHRSRGSTVGPGMQLNAGVDLRLNPGQGLEFSGSQVRSDLGAGLAFSGNDLRVGVLALVNEMLASSAVTGTKILANSIGAAHAVFQTAAIATGDIASLQVTKLTAGNLTVQMSVVGGGSVVAASGSTVAEMTPGQLQARNASQAFTALTGTAQIGSLSTANKILFSPNGLSVVNSSAIAIYELSAAADGLSVRTSGGSVRVDVTTAGVELFSSALAVSGVTAISSARGGDFTTLRARNRLTCDEAAADTTAPNWQWRIPVNNASGFLGWIKVSTA